MNDSSDSGSGSDSDMEHEHSPKMQSVLRKLPVAVRGIGEEVLHAISCGTKLMDWNRRYRLLINERVVPDTNIVELIRYALYPSEHDANEPRGLDAFVRGLKTIGLEAQWVRNRHVIDELEASESDIDDTSGDESENDNRKQGESDSEPDTEQSMDTEPQNAGEIDWKELSSDASGNELSEQ